MSNSLRLAVITLLLAVSNLSAAMLYVLLGSTNPTPPYATWAIAATNIQQAVGTAAAGDVVVVTNGEYAGGVAVTKPLALRSVNGPQFTVINGGGTNRCVSLTNGASLSGFTLSNGYSSGGDGGGVWSANAFLTNCVFVGNSATLTDTGNGGNGGGANGGTLYDCTLTGNSVSGTYNSMVRAYSCGGGAFGCVLYGLRVLEWVNCGVFRAPKRAKTSRGAGFVLHSTRPPAVEGSLDLQCLEFAI